MIYTVTLNPSIDYVVRLESLVTGITNRTTSEEYYFGGKGINVSCVLAELDLESTAFGFVAGFTGDAIENGYLVQSDSIANQSAQDRNNRVSPPIYVALLSTGSIEHVVVSVYVNR